LFINTSCSKRSNPSSDESPVYREKSVSTINMNADIINLVNEVRKLKNLPPLKVLQSASMEAFKHSEAMASKRVPFWTRWLQTKGHRAGQCSQRQFRYRRKRGYGKMTAKQVVAAWLKSSAHRANIEGNFTYTGVGVAKDPRGVIYYT